MTNWRYLLNGYAVGESNGKLWLFPTEVNDLFCIDLENGDCSTYGFEVENKKVLFTDLAINNNKIYLIPKNIDEIVIFDMMKKTYKKIPIPRNLLKMKRISNLYASGFIYGDDLIIIGAYMTNTILKYNLVDGKVNVWEIKCEEEQIENGGFLYSIEREVVDDICYIPFVYGGKMLELNVISGKTRIFTIVDKNEQIVAITAYNDELFLITDAGKVVMWNRISEKVDGIICTQIPFKIMSIRIENFYWIFTKDERAVRINLNNPEENMVVDLPALQVGRSTFYENQKCIVLGTEKGLYKLDVTKGTWESLFEIPKMDMICNEYVKRKIENMNYSDLTIEGTPRYVTMKEWMDHIIKMEAY